MTKARDFYNPPHLGSSVQSRARKSGRLHAITSKPGDNPCFVVTLRLRAPQSLLPPSPWAPLPSLKSPPA
ncbi:hypothetical protein ACQCRE_20120, partial [Ralstonia pseudosolanacearum]|uniref:hypothetical protein n=1 Tax=Ralstonia pseudosolanacearum TaxID=1310165 RepID=UPI003CF779E9